MLLCICSVNYTSSERAAYKSGTGTRGRVCRYLRTRHEGLGDIKYGMRGSVGRGRGDVKYRDAGDAGCEKLLQK